MTTITSRRHITKFYLSITLGALFFLAMGTGLIIKFIMTSHQGNVKPKDYVMFLFAVGVLFLGVYTVLRYFKNAPRIVIGDNHISFNDETFSLADIANVELTGKQSFPYIIYFPMEAATVHFKDGQTKFIFDDMYENTWELKLYLKQVVIDKSSYIIPENNAITNAVLDSEYFDTFKDNQFISLRGFFLWGLIGFFLIFLLTSSGNPPIPLITFALVFSSVWYGIHTWLMHYFEVSDRLLVVRNHLLPWKKKAYWLSDINEIVFESRGRMPNCLRIVFKNFKTNLYPAATLHKSTWLALKEKLESRSIKVRNECI